MEYYVVKYNGLVIVFTKSFAKNFSAQKLDVIWLVQTTY
jgi:hypothetical protein